MGITIQREKLQSAIQKNDANQLSLILSKQQDLINKAITEDGQSNLLTRTAYLGRSELVELLIAEGADVDWTSSSGMTALMWASRRGHIECCKLLISHNCALHKTGPHSMNACDFAVLNGYSHIAALLQENGLYPSKSPDEYYLVPIAKATVDYHTMLKSLKSVSSPLSTIDVDLILIEQL